MNRRLRSPRSQSKMEQGFNRFLRPGALARLRDSRISARSVPRSSLKNLAALSRFSPPSSPSPSPSPDVLAADQIDGFPCFASRAFGPRFPQRKKLAAAKSIFFVPSSPVGPEMSESAIDLLGGDLIVAH